MTAHCAFHFKVKWRECQLKVPKPRKLPSGSWFIQLRLGGESIPLTADTEKECIKQAEFIKAEYRAGKRTEKKESTGQNLTLGAAADIYIENRVNLLSPLTVRGYKLIRKYRFQAEMDRNVFEIAPFEWQTIINREARECGPKSLKNAWGFIRSVIKENVGSYPPDVKLPSIAPAEKAFLTPEQIKIFVAAVKDTKYAIPCLLALSSLRASEIEALDWKDIPQRPKFIKVSGAVVLNDKNQKVKKEQNKNASSKRNVPIMMPELAEAIERERKPFGPVMTYHQNSLRSFLFLS